MPRGSRRPKAGSRSSAPSGRAVLTASPPSSNRETLRRNRHEQKRTHYLASHRRAAIGRVGRMERSRKARPVVDSRADHMPRRPARARKSVVEGKSVSVRVDLGGRRIINKNKNKYNILNCKPTEKNNNRKNTTKNKK